MVVGCRQATTVTATYLASAIAMHQLLQTGAVDLVQIARRMQENRPSLIINASQYQFVYSLLADALEMDERFNTIRSATEI